MFYHNSFKEVLLLPVEGVQRVEVLQFKGDPERICCYHASWELNVRWVQHEYIYNVS